MNTGMPDRCSLAILQWDIRLKDFAANRQILENLWSQAVDGGANLVVLPEMWSAGFCGDELREEAKRLNERHEYCAALARRSGVWLAAGTLPEPSPDGKVFNTLYVFTPAGECCFTYRKIHLFPNTGEHLHFSSPVAFPELPLLPPPMKIGNWSIAAGICFEVRFPEVFRWYMKQGVHLFLLPAQFPDPRLAHFHKLSAARALENLAYVAAVNRTGGGSRMHFSGGSAVYDPLGKPLAEMGKKDGCRVFGLDLDMVKTVRGEYPFLDVTPVLDRLVSSWK